MVLWYDGRKPAKMAKGRNMAKGNAGCEANGSDSTTRPNRETDDSACNPCTDGSGVRYFEYGEEELAHLKAADSKLAPYVDLIESRGHIRRAMDDDLFASVVHHIIGQQISTAAQQTVWRRMVERFGEVSAQTLCAATVEDIQACGTTFRKAEYVKDFAQKVQSGAFDLQAVARMGDDEVIAALSSLKGI